MKSISYYLTLLVIRIKGIKSTFSQDPVDFRKLRKEDIHAPGLPGIKQFTIQNSTITEVASSTSQNGTIVLIHGGAFVSGPAKHHWDMALKLAAGTNCRVWLVDYPKAPENKIDTISLNIDEVYNYALKKFDNDKVILMGDSVGGTLVTALTQRLIKHGAPLPSLLILISPVMDSSLKNEKIPALEPKDPMLSTRGVLSAKKMCALDGNLDDPALSPINGSFLNFPSTHIYIAENDITSPDQELLVNKLKVEGVKLKVTRGKGMPHIWPLLPVMKEAGLARKDIISEIQKIIT